MGPCKDDFVSFSGTVLCRFPNISCDFISVECFGTCTYQTVSSPTALCMEPLAAWWPGSAPFWPLDSETLTVSCLPGILPFLLVLLWGVDVVSVSSAVCSQLIHSLLSFTTVNSEYTNLDNDQNGVV